MTALTLQQIARALGGEVVGKQVLAPAPGHGPKDRGLCVKLSPSAPDGFLVHLFNGGDPIAAKDYVRQKLGIEPFKPNSKTKPARTTSYDYFDAAGQVRYRKERYERGDGSKTFAFKTNPPKGYFDKNPHLLYGAERLADLGEGQPVWVVEGEECVKRLLNIGAIAVSGDTGADSKWTQDHAELLRGLRIILWPDSDASGEKYIANAAAAIRAAARRADIRVVRPFGPPDGAKGRDVCNWTGNAENLVELVERTAVAYEAPRRTDPPPVTGNGGGAGYEPPGETALLKRVITLTPYVWRDPRTLPRRPWVYGKHYIRKFVSATLAPGGLGKSSLALVEATAMATGRPLLGEPVPNRLRVAYWNGEDPVDEIDRRLAAILLHFKIPREEIEGWLFVDSGRTLPIRIASVEKGCVICTPDADALQAALIEPGIDVLILDPFVKTHDVPENDNGAIDRVARTFAGIAENANCSIELTHHVRKASNFGRAEITADDGRGAGSLKDAARCVRVMNVMAAAEAPSAQVKEKDRRKYFRVDDDGKANMTAPAESATWFKLVSVPLYNDERDEHATGDSIGVATSWKLPGVFAGNPPDALARVQAKIDSSDWGRDPRSGDWAGKAIAAVLELDLADEVQKERCKGMLAGWIESKALKVLQKPSPTTRGRDRDAVVVGSRVDGGISEDDT